MAVEVKDVRIVKRIKVRLSKEDLLELLGFESVDHTLETEWIEFEASVTPHEEDIEEVVAQMRRRVSGEVDYRRGWEERLGVPQFTIDKMIEDGVLIPVDDRENEKLRKERGIHNARFYRRQEEIEYEYE